MGSIYTPPSTFIFKTSFEAKLVYRYLKKKVKTLLRLIDDLFMIQIGSEEELLKSVNELMKAENNQINF